MQQTIFDDRKSRHESKLEPIPLNRDLNGITGGMSWLFTWSNIFTSQQIHLRDKDLRRCAWFNLKLLLLFVLTFRSVHSFNMLFRLMLCILSSPLKSKKWFFSSRTEHLKIVKFNPISNGLSPRLMPHRCLTKWSHFPPDIKTYGTWLD